MKKKVQLGVIGILFLSVLVYIAFVYVTKHVLAYSPIRPYRYTNEEIRKQLGSVPDPASTGMAFVEHDITVEDTIRLRGWFISSSSKPAQGTIFLLHGIGSCRIMMLPLVRTLTSNGFNCVLYDSRANGESGGVNCTFGYYEKADLSSYIDSTEHRFPGSGPYAVFGSSLGAAVAIQTMADEKRLVCGVAESPFANLRDIIHDYFARMISLRIDAIPDKALVYSERIARFSVDSVQPARSARRITQPVMIVHGLRDKNIDASYGKQVYDSVGSKKKIWYPISDGDHNDLGAIGGIAYTNSIVRFFKENLHNTRIDKEQAQMLAENFIRRNGYTQSESDIDSLHLTLESVEFASSYSELLKYRHNMIDPNAVEVRRDPGGWIVVFRYSRTNAGLRAIMSHHDDRTGRAVVMDSLGRNLHLEHCDIFLTTGASH